MLKTQRCVESSELDCVDERRAASGFEKRQERSEVDAKSVMRRLWWLSKNGRLLLFL